MKFIVLGIVLLFTSACHSTYSSVNTGRYIDSLIVLWSFDEQVEEILKYKRYSSNKTNAENMSRQHSIRGFRQLKKMDFSKAVLEFNKAYIFDQNNYMVYWGGALVCYEYAMSCQNGQMQILYLEKSISLFKEAKKTLPQDEYIHWGNDFALTLASLGALEKQRNSPKANTYFLEAQKIINHLLKVAPTSGRILLTKAIYCYYKGEYPEAYILLQQAKKNGYTIQTFESDLQKKMKP